MTDLLLRDVPRDLSHALKESAASDHRSMQGEAADLLQRAARRAQAVRRIQEVADKVRKETAGRYFRDSTLLIREDRDTDHGKYPFRYSVGEFAKVSDNIRERFRGQHFSDSTAITRADRDTDHGRE